MLELQYTSRSVPVILEKALFFNLTFKTKMVSCFRSERVKTFE